MQFNYTITQKTDYKSIQLNYTMTQKTDHKSIQLNYFPNYFLNRSKLIPNKNICFSFRFLRKQHRIRLHINFFVSFILSNLLSILWNVLVTYDRLTNSEMTDTLMYKNLVCDLFYFHIRSLEKSTKKYTHPHLYKHGQVFKIFRQLELYLLLNCCKVTKYRVQ